MDWLQTTYPAVQWSRPVQHPSVVRGFLSAVKRRSHCDRAGSVVTVQRRRNGKTNGPPPTQNVIHWRPRAARGHRNNNNIQVFADSRRWGAERRLVIRRRTLYGLKAPERIAFKYSVLVYKCLHESTPSYLVDELCQVADVEARQRLRSSSSSSLIVSRTRLSTVGDRAFPVAAARVWNSLPGHVTSAPSVAVIRSRLKTHLFDISYPDPV